MDVLMMQRGAGAGLCGDKGRKRDDQRHQWWSEEEVRPIFAVWPLYAILHLELVPSFIHCRCGCFSASATHQDCSIVQAPTNTLLAYAAAPYLDVLKNASRSFCICDADCLENGLLEWAHQTPCCVKGTGDVFYLVFQKQRSKSQVVVSFS